IDVGIVGTEDRRGFHRYVAVGELYRPTRDDDLAACGMVDLDENLALAHARLVHELFSIEHGTARHTLLAEDLHGLVLGVVLRPGLYVAVDLIHDLDAELRRREALVGLQILATDHLQQALPLNVIGAARVDIYVVVGSTGLALENV